MQQYNLRHVGPDGEARDLPFLAVGPEAALAYAMRIAPGRWATLSDASGEICRVQRVSHDAIWQVVRPTQPAN